MIKTTNVDMQSTSNEFLPSVNDRLMVLVNHFEGGKKVAFARKVGISPQAAQEILAGRRSEPSFKVLVKILNSYPQVRTEWLVLGRGSMLQTIDEVDKVTKAPIYATYEDFLESLQLHTRLSELTTERLATTHPELAKRVREHTAEAVAKQEVLVRIYSVSNTNATSGGLLLTDRLGVARNEALELIQSGRIRATSIGDGYRVTEKAVREFLGEA